MSRPALLALVVVAIWLWSAALTAALDALCRAVEPHGAPPVPYPRARP